MGIPERDGVIHHGMTKITSTQKENYIQYYDVLMKNPDTLFLDKPKIDFVKCDVEGYEYEVFSNMKNTILRHRPIVQSELSGEENRKKVIELFESWNFKTYLLEGEKLHQASEIEKTQASQDFYFISL
ncbi:MAG: FkbM family methyltransferase [Bacteroidales bacterium]|nr:FkbM family methyltransferase [Bacteroidales bacterium]